MGNFCLDEYFFSFALILLFRMIVIATDSTQTCWFNNFSLGGSQCLLLSTICAQVFIDICYPRCDSNDMGNADTKVHKAVKGQADHNAYPIYRYLDITGSGSLVDLMRKCMKTNDYEEIERVFLEEIRPFLYNCGNGAHVPIADLLKLRISERSTNHQRSVKKEPTGVRVKKNNVLPMMDVIEADECGYYVPTKDDNLKREQCWNIDKRGAAGETILHFCFLNTTRVHYELGKRLIQTFPKLINDYYLSDEYYGETVLHLAISNEEPAMVKFLLDHGAKVHQRCCGKFFSPSDQKKSRSDSLQYEWVDVPTQTNYQGNLYWGEYPICFAASTGHEEIVRLLLAKGADPNMQDTNGNTVLHILVINSPRLDTIKVATRLFSLLVKKGGRLDIKNRLGLTPLTLAAKLGRAEMYNFIQELEQHVLWKYGNIVSAVYPLSEVDSIYPDGTVNKNSALMLAVYGNMPAHLDMIGGLLSHLLDEKWNTFVKKRFCTQLVTFIIYFIFFITAFYTRPGKDRSPKSRAVYDNITNSSYLENMTDPCYLLKIQGNEDIIRFVCEIFIVLGSIGYIAILTREIYYHGFSITFTIMTSVPTRCIHIISCFLVLLMVPGRAACQAAFEDVIGVIAVLCTAPYFLFFFRAFRLIGPFVVMIFNMIKGDLFRFIVIYMIILVGFSQAMFMVFRNVNNSIFHDPFESLMGMFIMSLGVFSDIYEQFDCSNHSDLGKMLFIVYMILGALLLINMLIAMMANTYTLVNETQQEWLRQWAQIALVIEHNFSIKERRNQQLRYTQPLRDGRRALLVNRLVKDDK